LLISVRPARKFHTLSEETTIVIQVVDIEFTSAASDSGDILGRNLVTLLWDNLIRGLEAIGIIEIHQVEREIAARMGFDVVRHDEATGGAIWPKPNERHLLRVHWLLTPAARFLREDCLR